MELIKINNEGLAVILNGNKPLGILTDLSIQRTEQSLKHLLVSWIQDAGAENDL